MFDFINYKFVSFLAVILLAFMCFTDRVLAADNDKNINDIECVNVDGNSFDFGIATGTSSDNPYEDVDDVNIDTEINLCKLQYFIATLTYNNQNGCVSSFNYNYPLALYKDNGFYKLIIYKDNKFYLLLSSSKTYKLHGNISGFQPLINGKFRFIRNIDSDFNEDFILMESELYKTNIYTFDTLEHSKEYLVNGKTDGLLNKDDTDLKYTYDSSVPVPGNVHIEQFYMHEENNAVTLPVCNLNFTETQDYIDAGGRYEIKWRIGGSCVERGLFTEKSSNRADFTTGFFNSDLLIPRLDNEVGCARNPTEVIYYFEKFEDMEFKKSLSAYQQVNEKAGALSSVLTKPDKIEFYIRNITADNRSSDWVRCSYGFDVDDLKEHYNNKTIEGTTDVVDGSKNPEDITDSDIKSSYEITDPDKEDSADSGSIIDWIKNGLGLLGDDGLIHMLGDVFSFLPRPIITILISTVSVCCFIVIIKFIRG